MTNDAEKLNEVFSDAFLVMQRAFQNIHNLLSVVVVGLRSQPPVMPRPIHLDPQMETRLTDVQKMGLQTPEAEMAMADMNAKTYLLNAINTLDAASLVFAHSILDDLTIQYCQISITAAPEDWQNEVADTKLSLAEFRSKPTEETIRDLPNSYMNSVRRLSLPKRVELLCQKCKPRKLQIAAFTVGEKPFRLDMDRLRVLDKRRHTVVHELNLWEMQDSTDDDLEYMKTVGKYLSVMVGLRYNLRVDVSRLRNTIAKQDEPLLKLVMGLNDSGV